MIGLRHWLLPILLPLALAACDTPRSKADDKAPAKAPSAPPADVKTVEVGKNVTLEIRGDTRRVVLAAAVCLREGPLEMFLCRTNTKEHEAIVHVDTDARLIHTALLAAGAKPGTTVKWEPKYQPATGSVIKVSVRYTENGKEITRGVANSDSFLEPLDRNQTTYESADDGLASQHVPEILPVGGRETGRLQPIEQARDG